MKREFVINLLKMVGKNIVIFSRVLIRLYAGLEIFVQHRSLRDKYILFIIWR